MYVCMYKCMYVYINVYVYVCMHVCMERESFWIEKLKLCTYGIKC